MMGLLLGIFFCIITIWGIFNAVKIAIHPQENQIRRNYIIGSIVGIVVLYFVAYTPYTEYNLLYNYIWVNGKLIDRCYGKGAGPGPSYEFEYYVDGKRYTNCNSAGDLKGIKFPNGIYSESFKGYAQYWTNRLRTRGSRIIDVLIETCLHITSGFVQAGLRCE